MAQRLSLERQQVLPWEEEVVSQLYLGFMGEMTDVGPISVLNVGCISCTEAVFSFTSAQAHRHGGEFLFCQSVLSAYPLGMGRWSAVPSKGRAVSPSLFI